tara:strand:- start:184 stop:300 length:117 start_codon:yes stop_codon:yes gene_type:complete
MDSLGGVDILWTKTFDDEFDDREYDIAAFFSRKKSFNN